MFAVIDDAKTDSAGMSMVLEEIVNTLATVDDVKDGLTNLGDRIMAIYEDTADSFKADYPSLQNEIMEARRVVNAGKLGLGATAAIVADVLDDFSEIAESFDTWLEALDGTKKEIDRTGNLFAAGTTESVQAALDNLEKQFLSMAKKTKVHSQNLFSMAPKLTSAVS